MNSVCMVGRLTANPEMKSTSSGIEYVDFRIAVDRDYQKNGERVSDFFSVKAWRATAAFIEKYFHKGDGIEIKGSLENHSYVTGGENRTYTYINAERVGFTPGKKSDNTAPASNYSTSISDAPVVSESKTENKLEQFAQLLDEQGVEHTETDGDDDLPF